jgi:two-component system, NarL family, invasion response regulator UvrY
MNFFLIIDDHEVVRTGIKTVLQEFFKPCEVHEAHNDKTALEQLKARAYNLIIMDVQMPDTDTSGLLDYIKVAYAESKVLIFSMAPENIYGKRFLKAGAMGFVAKNTGLAELQKAIEMILNGRIYMSNALLEQLVVDMNGSKKVDNPFEKLSSRELEIVSLITSGKSITEISNILSLAISTVGTYKARLFEKLKVNNLVELIELWHLYNNSSGRTAG